MPNSHCLTHLGFEPKNDDLKVEPNIDQLTKDFTIFVDTEPLLDPSANVIFNSMLPFLSSNQNRLVVSERSVNYIQDHADDAENRNNEATRNAISLLKKMDGHGVLVVAKEPNGPLIGDRYCTESLYKEKFVQFQMAQNMCLITQRETLAHQILKNSRNNAIQRGVKRIDTYYLSGNKLNNWIPKLLQRSTNTEQRFRNDDILGKISKDYKIIVDTCSLALTKFDDDNVTIGDSFFRNTLLPALKETGNRLIVPGRVKLELDKHVNSENPALSSAAQKAIDTLTEYAKSGLLAVGREEDEIVGVNESFADPVFLRLAIRFQSDSNICIITQDTSLARVLLDNRDQSSCKEYLVLFVTQNCKLALWESKLSKAPKEGFTNSSKTGNHSVPAREGGSALPPAKPDKAREFPRPAAGPPPTRPAGASASTRPAGFVQRNTQRRGADGGRPGRFDQPATQGNSKTVNNNANNNASDNARQTSNEPFKLVSVVNPANNTMLEASAPDVGAVLHGAKSGAFTLTEFVAEGGEGAIYLTSLPNVVCKTYFKEQLTGARKEKLDLMLSRNIAISGVCWPQELVFDGNGNFIGYLMPKAEGRKLRSVLHKKLMANYFPGWKRETLTQLAITILKTIDRLHKLNIFIGDINPENILVVNEKRVFVVDCDSFQVEGFPCPVGTDTFTSPDRQGQNFTKFLRSREDELFAVTTLLFMILFPGKAPYSAQGGSEISENIKNRTFPYVRDNDSKPPDGPWQFIWSHLPRQLKEDFAAVFARGERIPIEDLTKHLNWSLKDIQSGKQTNEVFPDKPWQREGSTVTVYCELCPPEKAKTEISIKEFERLEERGENFRCKSCRTLKKVVKLDTTREVSCESQISPQCKKVFSISTERLDKMRREGKGCWCKPCLDEQMTIWEQERRPRRSSYGYGNSHRHQAKAGCFVATATYQSEVAPEVLFLRKFRDLILRKTRLGRGFVRNYYAYSPYLAGVIYRFPFLRTPARCILNSVIGLLKKAYKI